MRTNVIFLLRHAITPAKKNRLKYKDFILNAVSLYVYVSLLILVEDCIKYVTGSFEFIMLSRLVDVLLEEII